MNLILIIKIGIALQPLHTTRPSTLATEQMAAGSVTESNNQLGNFLDHLSLVHESRITKLGRNRGSWAEEGWGKGWGVVGWKKRIKER